MDGQQLVQSFFNGDPYARQNDGLPTTNVVFLHRNSDFTALFRQKRKVENEVFLLYFLPVTLGYNLCGLFDNLHTFHKKLKQKR